MWRQVVAQSPGENAPASEVLRYDIGWKALNTMLNSGRSLSGHERNCAFLNTGDGGGGRFADISAAAGIDFDDDGRVVSLSDWDGDGDLDFWIANRTAPQVRFLRNNTSSENQWVQFKLRGTTSNRDAVGARVELVLASGGGLRARTMRSGGGYLGQSSKWLHFGFEKTAPPVESIMVRWPDGSEETIPPVPLNGRYMITQGTGVAQPTGGERNIVFKEEVIPPPPVDGAARIVLITPPPIPAMEYENEAGETLSVTSTTARAKLVTLWASWCVPCLTELKSWGEQAAAFRDNGVEVLAINVEDKTERATAGAAYAKLAVPFASGYGGTEIASQFDVLQRALLSRQRPLPLPSSFLLDSEGNVRVIYKGPVDADQVLADAALVNAPLAEILESAVPYPGKWLGQPAGTSPNAIAVRFVEGGYLKEAETFLRRLTDGKSAHPTFSPTDAYVLLGAILLDQERLDEAVTAFESALEITPHHRQAHIELAGTLSRLKRPDDAVPHYLAALERRADDPDLRYRLGMAFLEAGAVDKAVNELETVANIRPTPMVHHNLGNLLLGQGKTAEAVDQFEKALEFDPNFFQAANNIAWLKAASADASLREPARAVALAEHICALPDGKTATHFDTLAVAYASAGRYGEAVESAKEAIRLAKAEGDLVTVKDLRTRLSLFEKQQPYRDAS